jgi:DNA-binding XRE family transcriptional regulator
MPVYAIQAGESGPVKLGVATDPRMRLGELQISHYLTLTLLRVWKGGVAEEAALHARFDALRLRGEWFSFSREMLGDVGLVEIIEPIPPEPVPAQTMRDMGIALRELRAQRQLSQGDVALRTGIARSTIASIETGHDLPGRSALFTLANFFDVSVEFLCGKAAA